MPESEASPSSLGLAQTQNAQRNTRFSRSPHPYHRCGLSLSSANPTVSLPKSVNSPSPTAALRPAVDPVADYFDADHRKRRKGHDSLSDSGTEADDEKGAVLLGLPAPPARLHKGLKGSDGSASPLLTPSYLDDASRRPTWGAQTSRRASLQSKSTDEDTAKIREKFVKRRRAELYRRVSETALLLTVSLIAGRRFSIRPWTRTSSGTSEASLHNWNITCTALITYTGVVLSLYALYPLRIIYKNHACNLARRRSPFYIHLPAAFDPAPLLYPVILPVIVAWSITRTDIEVLIPNLILAIASIPSKIIPLGNVYWCSSPQWLLSILPAVTSRMWPSVNQTQGQHVLFEVQNGEPLLLLYPFHQALLPVLQYLMTTSLLPAELQLLSVAMINVSLLSKHPQSTILKALLWIGGIFLLILCTKVLKWGVTLARIPTWRFRKPTFRLARSSNFLNEMFGMTRVTVTSSESSDDEPDIASGGNGPWLSWARASHLTGSRKPSKLLSKSKTIGLNIESRQALSNHVPASPSSATGSRQAFEKPFPDTAITNSLLISQRLRSHTMPTYMSTTGPALQGVDRVFNITNRECKAWTFRSLTASQATVLRWIFAFYVYAVVVLVVAFPIRTYVSRHALLGKEPIGWALGYLFGDLPAFRSSVEYRKLSHWILLPHEEQDSAVYVAHKGRIEAYCSFVGAANIRLAICLYCLVVIIVGLVIVLRLSAIVEVDTRRKVFHGMMVAMFLPTIFVDPAFVALALILVLAIFLLLDLFRASQLPPIAKPLTFFLAPYVDGRDHRGPVIVSHIFLLIGCAIPLWLSVAAVSRSGDYPWEQWDVPTRDISMISGVVCVGMGDAAASLVGRRYGRRRWCWSGGKSLEGSLAFVVAVVLGLSAAQTWLHFGGWDSDNSNTWKMFTVKATIAGCGASLTEAVLTGGNDNVIVPVILWLLVKGLSL